jgi:hypothetical protein
MAKFAGMGLSFVPGPGSVQRGYRIPDARMVHRGAGRGPAARQIYYRIFCEQLADVGEGLEFERIARRVEKKHCRLFARLALEADVGLDDEAHASCDQFLGQPLPFRHRQHGAEMAHRDLVAIDVAGVPVPGFARC